MRARGGKRKQRAHGVIQHFTRDCWQSRMIIQDGHAMMVMRSSSYASAKQVPGECSVTPLPLRARAGRLKGVCALAPRHRSYSASVVLQHTSASGTPQHRAQA